MASVDTAGAALDEVGRHLGQLSVDTGLGAPPTKAVKLAPSIHQSLIERLAALGYLAPGSTPKTEAIQQAVRAFKRDAFGSKKPHARVGGRMWAALLDWTVLERTLPDNPKGSSLRARALRQRMDALGMTAFPTTPRYPALFKALRAMGLPRATGPTNTAVQAWEAGTNPGPDRIAAFLLQDLDGLVVRVHRRLNQLSAGERAQVAQSHGSFLQQLAHLDLQASGMIDGQAYLPPPSETLPEDGGDFSFGLGDLAFGLADGASQAPEPPEPAPDDGPASVPAVVDHFAARSAGWAQARGHEMVHALVEAGVVPAPPGQDDLLSFSLPGEPPPPADPLAVLDAFSSVLAERGAVAPPLDGEADAMASFGLDAPEPEPEPDLDTELPALLLAPATEAAARDQAEQLQKQWKKRGPLATLWEGAKRVAGWLKRQWANVKAWVKGAVETVKSGQAWKAVLRWLGQRLTGLFGGLRIAAGALSTWVGRKGHTVRLENTVVGGFDVDLDFDLRIAVQDTPAAHAQAASDLRGFQRGFRAATGLVGAVVQIVVGVVQAFGSGGLLSWLLIPRLVKAWKALKKSVSRLRALARQEAEDVEGMVPA